MGKWLYTNLYMIFSRLGAYAFPNGKPQIDWGGGNPPVIPPCTVSKTIGTGLSSTGGDSDVAFGDPLEVSIAITDNLYIIDDDNVEVTMGGSPVAGAWNANTMKVTIAAVTGDVVVNVPSMTYVLPSNLAFHLDCMNRGGQSGHWIDRIGGVDFKLTDVTEADSGMVFNGSSSKALVMDDNDPTQPAALGSKYVDVAFDAGTIEVIAEADNGSLPTASNRITCPVFINPKDGGLIAAFRMGGSSTGYASCVLFMYTCRSSGNLDDNFAFLYNGSYTLNGTTYTANGGNDIAVSAHTNLTVDGIVRIDGVTQGSTRWFDTWIGGPSQTRFSVGYYYRNNNGTITEAYFKGKIKAIRVYNTKLTEQQMIQNYKVDKKRFNLQ